MRPRRARARGEETGRGSAGPGSGLSRQSSAVTGTGTGTRLSLSALMCAAALLRAALVAYGEWQDEVMVVKYTDVDYRVYTDAARLVAEGRSPYGRATYRYSPLLAAALVPNVLVHRAFGKAVFAAGDLLAAWLIARLLRRRGASVLWAAAWLFNPLVFTVSTRGNADVVVCVLVLAVLALLADGRATASGAVYGAAVHTRIYPAVYAPALLLLLLAQPRGRRRGPLLRFGLAAAAVFVALGAACYAACGPDFVEHAFAYHLTRRDHRHNFSPYFYELYLGGAGAGGPGGALAHFVPQFGLVLAFAGRYGAAWPELCLLLQTMAFVALNKVCTAQYFVWYSALLPLVLPHLRLSPARGAAMAAVWLGAELHWLSWAYRLEFLGQDVFLGVWAAGLLFFAANAWVVLSIVRAAARARPLAPFVRAAAASRGGALAK